MARKTDFRGSLNDIIDGMKDQTPNPNVTPTAHRPKSAKGLRDGLNRFSIVLPVELMEQLRAIAYWNQLKVKDVIYQFISNSLDLYKEKHGEPAPIPEKENTLL